MSARPALVMRFLAEDPGLCAGSVRVWAEAAFRAKAIFDEVTIAVVDTTAGLRTDLATELEMVCQSSSVQFRHLCAPSGTTLADVTSDLCRTADDVLLVADPADVPSPWMLERMLASLSATGAAIIDAHPLPIASPDQADSTPAGVCALLSAGTCAELGGFEVSSPRADIGRLHQAAELGGHEVAVDRRATIFWDLRVTPDGSPMTTGIHEVLDEPELEAPAHPAGVSHPAMLETTSLGEVLRSTGAAALVDDAASPSTCFLTVLTRTQGVRPQCLEETLLCLAAQTVRDFEVVIACHRVSQDALRETAELVAGFPPWLQDRVRIIEVDRPGRAAPLNDALDVANGRYVVILDDDDLVLAHWVETFMRLEQVSPGRMLRAVALRQDVIPARSSGSLTADAVGRPRSDWPVSFELVDHLDANATPCLSVAFPRGVYADLGYRFDEGMLAIEDWEYLVRTATLVGVESGSEATSVYRWWLEGESSRTAQTPDDWIRARALAHDTIDSRVVLLPSGSTRRIRFLFEENRRAWVEVARARAEVETANQAHEVTTARLAEVVTAHEQAVSRAQTADARVVRLRRRLRRQQRQAERRSAVLRQRIEESAAVAPAPTVLERLVQRGVSLRRSRHGTE